MALFPTNPASGDIYTNPVNSREYQYVECASGEGYWDNVVQPALIPKFGAYNNATSYKVGDHVYYQTSVFKAITPSLGAFPTWSKTTTEWEYIGNLLNYNPDLLLNDQTDGSVLTYVGGKYVLRKPPGGVQRLSGVEKATYQCGPVMKTSPQEYVKLTASARMNGGAASYIPSIIVNSGGWADLGAANYAPEDQTYSAFNQEAGVTSIGFLDNPSEEQYVVKDFTDADWGNGGDGLRTVPQSYRNLMAAGTTIDGRRGSGTLTFEAHVNKGDGRWDCHYTYVGAMGNHKANYGRIEMGWSWPKELFDNMSGIGFKMMKRPDKTHTTEIDFRWQCEWH